MTAAYVDSSALIAVAFGESHGAAIAERLYEYSALVSSNLLEAEMLSAFAREGRGLDDAYVPRIQWILPTYALTDEIARTLRAGYLKGADLWHVANALYARRDLGDIAFLTLDVRQRSVARNLGFSV